MIPTPLALFLGCVLVAASFYLLYKSFDGPVYFAGVAIFIGFLPFLLGSSLIFFSFLPNAPTIFGLAVEHVKFFGEAPTRQGKPNPP